jgi:hypothetical protein
MEKSRRGCMILKLSMHQYRNLSDTGPVIESISAIKLNKMTMEDTMSKRAIGLITAALILSLFVMNSPRQAAYANGADALQGTEKPEAEGTKEAKDNPFCTPATSTTPQKQQPKAAKIAEAYGVPYADVIGWFCKGYGFGQIERAYVIAKASATGKTPLTVAQIFTMRDAGQGWPVIANAAGLSMRDLHKYYERSNGQGKDKDKADKSNKGGKGNKGNKDKDDKGKDDDD